MGSALRRSPTSTLFVFRAPARLFYDKKKIPKQGKHVFSRRGWWLERGHLTLLFAPVRRSLVWPSLPDLGREEHVQGPCAPAAQRPDGGLR